MQFVSVRYCWPADLTSCPIAQLPSMLADPNKTLTALDLSPLAATRYLVLVITHCPPIHNNVRMIFIALLILGHCPQWSLDMGRLDSLRVPALPPVSHCWPCPNTYISWQGP